MPSSKPSLGVIYALSRVNGNSSLEELQSFCARGASKHDIKFESWRDRFAKGVPPLRPNPSLEVVAGLIGPIGESRLRSSHLRYGLETRLLPPIGTVFQKGNKECYTYEWLYAPDDGIYYVHREESSRTHTAEMLDRTLSRKELALRCRDWLARAIDGKAEYLWTGTALHYALEREPHLGLRAAEFAYYLSLAKITYGLYSEAYRLARQSGDRLAHLGLGNDMDKVEVLSNLRRVQATAAGFMYYIRPERALPDFETAETAARAVTELSPDEGDVHRLKWLREIVRYAARQAQTGFKPNTSDRVDRQRSVLSFSGEPGISYDIDVLMSELEERVLKRSTVKEEDPFRRIAPIDWDTLARGRMLLRDDVPGGRMAYEKAVELQSRLLDRTDGDGEDPGSAKFALVSSQITMIILMLKTCSMNRENPSLCETVFGRPAKSVLDDAQDLLREIVKQVGEDSLKHFRIVLRILSNWHKHERQVEAL